MKRWKKFLRTAAPVLRRTVAALAEWVAVYLDDFFLLGGGVCLVLAAAELGGRPAALITAGVWCTVYAIVVARARGAGR